MSDMPIEKFKGKSNGLRPKPAFNAFPFQLDAIETLGNICTP